MVTLLRVFEDMCYVFGLPHIDLLATQTTSKLPMLDPMAWKQDTSQRHFDNLKFFYFFVICPSKTGLVKRDTSTGSSMVLVAPLWPQKEWFAQLVFLVEEPLGLPMLWNLLVQPHVRKFQRGLQKLQLNTWELSSDLSERQALRESYCGHH